VITGVNESETYLTPSLFREQASALYTSTKGTNYYTVAFRSQLGWALFWFYFMIFGAFSLVSAFMAVIDLSDNVSDPFLGIAVGALFTLWGAWLLTASIDLRSITVTPGRATVAWRLFGWPIRTGSFDVRLVVVQHDLWKRGGASTDRVVLQGEQMLTVTTLWNAPRVGSCKPPLSNMAVGPGSEFPPYERSRSERTVSPVILGLAASLSVAASAPLILRTGNTHRPWITVGSD
jgi:hypothetical protein